MHFEVGRRRKVANTNFKKTVFLATVKKEAFEKIHSEGKINVRTLFKGANNPFWDQTLNSSKIPGSKVTRVQDSKDSMVSSFSYETT